MPARLGLTPQDVAQTLQTLLSGYTVTQYREGIEHIDVVARAVADERLELNRLPALDHHHTERRRRAAVADRTPPSTNTRSRSCGAAIATSC